MLVKVFRVTAYERLSFVFEGTRATVHWRADIHSKITGAAVPTELVDLVEFQDDRIVKYCEFFVPQGKPNPIAQPVGSGAEQNEHMLVTRFREKFRTSVGTPAGT